MELTEKADRVRAHTAEAVNQKIDLESLASLENYARRTPEEISVRIAELDAKWDVERVLEMNASTLALLGVVLGAFLHPAWLIVPGIVLPFLMLHAIQGWCPPLPILRRLGVRTRQELDREKYTLKALRGDFTGAVTAAAAWKAAR